MLCREHVGTFLSGWEQRALPDFIFEPASVPTHVDIHSDIMCRVSNSIVANIIPQMVLTGIQREWVIVVKSDTTIICE